MSKPTRKEFYRALGKILIAARGVEWHAEIEEYADTLRAYANGPKNARPAWPTPIKTAERLPTREDANDRRDVLALSGPYGWRVTQWDDVGHDIHGDGETHWLPMPPKVED